MEMLNINRKLLPVKTHYFLLNAGNSGSIPFIAVYAKQMGIGADVMGYIYAVLSCVTVISRPLLGGVADHFQKIKLVLISLIFILIAADLGLSFIPAPPSSPSNSTNSSQLCLRNTSYVMRYQTAMCNASTIPHCPIDCTASCTLCSSGSNFCNDDDDRNVFNYSQNCISSIFEKCDSNCEAPCAGDSVDCADAIEANPPLQLWLLALFTFLIYVSNGSVVSLSDAACFNALENKPELYGKQRMWGTIGWGSFALLAGYLNQTFTGSSGSYSYAPGFYMAVAIFFVDLLVVPTLKLKDVKTSKNIFKDVGFLLMKPRIIIFILQVFSIGVFVGMSRSYLFWYLRSLNANQLLLGLTSVVQCFFGELPFFFFSGWIITKLGHVNTFTMSFIAHGVKFLGYSFLYNPWFGLPIEITQGPAFGSFYSAMTSYAKIVAPTGTEATVQGVASATLEGLGIATGSLLGGYGFRVYGGRTTFFWTGIISFICAMVNCIINAIIVCKNPRSP